MFKKVLKWGLLAAVLIQFIPYGHTHTNPPVSVGFSFHWRTNPPGLLRLP